jgi:hypothetical protein
MAVATTVLRAWNRFSPLVRNAGPYLLLELVMPGGTLLALLLFLYQRRVALAGGWAAAASVWRGRHRERDGLEALAAVAPTGR